MASPFTSSDFDRIASALGVDAQHEGSLVRFSLVHEESGRKLAIEISPEVSLPDGIESGSETALVSVFGSNSFSQLQGCTGVVASEDLGEVIFFAREGGRVSGLVVERRAGCSLYANISEKLLSADFTQLPPEIMMSAVALSMSEPLFE